MKNRFSNEALKVMFGGETKEKEEKYVEPAGFQAQHDLQWCYEQMDEKLSDLDREYLIERMYNAGMHLFKLLNEKKENELKDFVNLDNWSDAKVAKVENLDVLISAEEAVKMLKHVREHSPKKKMK
jgi:hypothetical protein